MRSENEGAKPAGTDIRPRDLARDTETIRRAHEVIGRLGSLPPAPDYLLRRMETECGPVDPPPGERSGPAA